MPMPPLVIDPDATALLFGDEHIVWHLYRILHASLPLDHQQLIDACQQRQMQTARMMIHRLCGALRYCKVPAYEQALTHLEASLDHDWGLALQTLDIEFLKLYALLTQRLDMLSA